MIGRILDGSSTDTHNRWETAIIAADRNEFSADNPLPTDEEDENEED